MAPSVKDITAKQPACWWDRIGVGDKAQLSVPCGLARMIPIHSADAGKVRIQTSYTRAPPSPTLCTVQPGSGRPRRQAVIVTISMDLPRPSTLVAAAGIRISQ
jgi:hypothetical protein